MRLLEIWPTESFLCHYCQGSHEVLLHQEQVGDLGRVALCCGLGAFPLKRFLPRLEMYAVVQVPVSQAEMSGFLWGVGRKRESLKRSKDVG